MACSDQAQKDSEANKHGSGTFVWCGCGWSWSWTSAKDGLVALHGKYSRHCSNKLKDKIAHMHHVVDMSGRYMFKSDRLAVEAEAQEAYYTSLFYAHRAGIKERKAHAKYLAEEAKKKEAIMNDYDEPDMDDMINDYIADQDEGPPEYEEFDEAPDPYDFEERQPMDNNNNGVVMGDTAAIKDAAAEPPHDDEDDVPKVISTDSTSPVTVSSLHRNNGNDIYGFECFTGVNGWRSTANTMTKLQLKQSKNGATIMEATSWKKKKQEVDKDDISMNDDDSSIMDTDEMDNGRVRSKRDFTSTNNIPAGSKMAVADAQLVRFRERQEKECLGRTWGVTATHWNGGNDERFLHGKHTTMDSSLPRLGEDSMAVTLANGTRTFVKRSRRDSIGGRPAEVSSNEANQDDNKEINLLGLPMSELIRRADIIQKRAIRRKLEREERYGKKVNATPEADLATDAAASVNENDSMNEVDATKENDNSQVKEDIVDEEVTVPKVKPITTKEEIKRQQEAERHRREVQYQQRLWVDKHAPTTISHLLSDERTNREVLRALRGWDPYVFKKDAPARPTPAYTRKYQGGQQQQQQQQNNGKGKPNKGKDSKNRDKEKKNGDDDENVYNQKVDLRPDERSRVILLSGPPGVGKSTLAHIVCKHAGYRPIEVNASDERSASALTERVTRAMESSTLNMGEDSNSGKAGKPNCIILDEVDGADAKTSIAALVNIIRAEIPTPSKRGGKKGKGARATYLRRPIILICNHKHAPALRPILPYAKQFDVQPPNPERLIGRLRAVLSAERMSVVAGGMLLHRLVASTGGDIRSCLYALQFASARARELTMKKRERDGIQPGEDSGVVMCDISSTLMAALDKSNGLKDMQGDVSGTVATVFRKKKSSGKNKRQKTSTGASSLVSSDNAVDFVLEAVNHFGDNSKTLDCLFMNVNRVSYVDPTLDRCSVAFEWLSEADTFRSHNSNVAMNNSAEHHFMQKFYIPTAAAAIHVLCCVETKPDLTFSTRPLSDMNYQNQANVSLVQRFMEGLAPRARSGVGGGTNNVVSDVIPFSLWLLSAGDGKHSLSKPVSSVEMLQAEEKLAFSAHVATLRALGLTYVKEDVGFNNTRNFDNENVRLEPEIDKLVKFEGMDDTGRKQIPALLKELLAHGATVAALRERELEAKEAQDVGEKAALKKDLPKEVSPSKLPTKATTTPAKKSLPKPKTGNNSAAKNFLGKRAAKAKEAKSLKRAAIVGFDRSKKTKFSNTGSGVELSKVIRFKYQKGFSQAVRAPCPIEDLID